ncbi:uncharacterized protein LOC113216456 [Frankliniella occidentalis]|uniref:ATP-dependent DNA helicase n=1 Tax=Frankliniella occidentalis TaxID=133901 RepID=A0A9C6U717_FRAOC|nr:uncharacterized protein LOC113216456 [Frankliniella occidentalis]
MDIAPVLSKNALVNYLAKYVAKNENCSSGFNDLIAVIFGESPFTIKSVVQRLFIKAISERDYSAQEVGRILMQNELVSCSRNFVYVYLNNDVKRIKVATNNNNAKCGRSIVQKYMNRSEDYENISLWLMAQSFDFSKQRKRTNKAIVSVVPKISYKLSNLNNENYFKQQVILHVPWRSDQDFPTDVMTWQEIYDLHKSVIEQHKNHLGLDGLVAAVEDTECDVDAADTAEYIASREEWMAISAMRPTQVTEEIQLGNRSIDNFNWHQLYDKYKDFYTISELQTFIATSKGNFETSDDDIIPFPNVHLNVEQEKILSLVKDQIGVIVDSSKACGNVPKTVVVQGSAGTGKSTVIQAITNTIQSTLGVDSVLVLAPTGVAAVNIKGSTIHSRLFISSMKEFADLTNEAARKFCNNMKNVKFVIVDEYSMVGCGMLGMIYLRLRQATGRPNDLFGGLNVENSMG